MAAQNKFLVENLYQNLSSSTYRNGIYDVTDVLALHWDTGNDENTHYRKEAEAFTEVFKTNLGYQTNIYEIPINDSQLHLGQQIDKSLETSPGEKKLLIIHYGGNADPDPNNKTDSEQRTLWTAYVCSYSFSISNTNKGFF